MSSVASVASTLRARQAARRFQSGLQSVDEEDLDDEELMAALHQSNPEQSSPKKASSPGLAKSASFLRRSRQRGLSNPLGGGVHEKRGVPAWTVDLDEIAEKMREGLETGNHRANLRVLKDTFRAVEALEWLVVKSGQCRDVCDALIVGNRLLRSGAVASAAGFAKTSAGFNNINGIYRFGQHEANFFSPDEGEREQKEAGEGSEKEGEVSGGGKAPETKAVEIAGGEKKGVFSRLSTWLEGMPVSFYLIYPVWLPLIFAYYAYWGWATAVAFLGGLHVQNVDRRCRKRVAEQARTDAVVKTFRNPDCTSDTESSEWWSGVFDSIWEGWARNWLNKLTKENLNWLLEFYCPSFLESIQIDEFDYGAMPPVIKTARCYQGGYEGNTPERKIEWDLDLHTIDFKVILSARLGGKRVKFPLLRLIASDVFVSGKLRLGLGWCEIPGGPYLKFLRVSFLDTPKYGLSLRPYSSVAFDLAELPLLDKWVQNMLGDAINAIVEPNNYLWDIEEWWWRDEEMPVEESAEGDSNKDSSKPTVSVDLVMESASVYDTMNSATSRSYYCKLKRGRCRGTTVTAKTNEPVWKEFFNLDANREEFSPRVILKLYKASILAIGAPTRSFPTDDLVGVGVIPDVLAYNDGKIHNLNIDLFHIDRKDMTQRLAGTVRVRVSCNILIDPEKLNIVEREQKFVNPQQQFSSLMHKISDNLPLPHLLEAGHSDGDDDDDGKHANRKLSEMEKEEKLRAMKQKERKGSVSNSRSSEVAATLNLPEKQPVIGCLPKCCSR